MHADRVGLHHGSVAENVDNQAGKSISLAVYETIDAVCIGIDVELQGFSHTIGFAQASYPKMMVDWLITEGKNAHGDGTYLVMATSYENPVAVYDVNHLSFLRKWFAIQRAAQGTGENPGVESFEAFGFSAAKLECGH